MTLDIPKRGRGRPKKVPDNKEEIDIAINFWIDHSKELEPTEAVQDTSRPFHEFMYGPEKQETSIKQDALVPIRSASELVLILVLIIGVCVGIVYWTVRI